MTHDELMAVLLELLARHPELRGEAEAIAYSQIVPPAAEIIAAMVHDALTSVPDRGRP